MLLGILLQQPKNRRKKIIIPEPGQQFLLSITPMHSLLLRNMQKDQKGIIEKITVSGELGRRLRAMGLTPGTPITVCGRAPLYDPVAIRVLNSTLTLRNNEADHILVKIA
jgi:ferrous iron transport protein A